MNFINEDVLKAVMKARDKEMRKLSAAMLRSNALSENKKMCIRIINKAKDINQGIMKGIDSYVHYDACEEHNIEILKEMYEYLALVNAGITQFFEEISKRGKSK